MLASNIYGRIIPITDGHRLHSDYLPDLNKDASYPCSFSRLYVDLAAIEFKRATSWFLRILATLLLPIAALLRALGIDRCVWINASLLGTGPLDNWSGSDLAALTASAIACFLGEAVI